jgi:hypothetical protein
MEVEINKLEKIAEGTLLKVKETFPFFGNPRTTYTYLSKKGKVKNNLKLRTCTDVTQSTAEKGDIISVYKISKGRWENLKWIRGEDFVVVEIRRDFVSPPKHTYIGPASEVKAYF